MTHNRKERDQMHRKRSSRVRASTHLDPVSGGEEFNGESGDHCSDHSSMTNNLVANPAIGSVQSLKTRSIASGGNRNTVMDIQLFFTEAKVGGTQRQVCKTCAEVHGLSQHPPRGVPNYTYALTTANNNLRGHMYREHPQLYDDTVKMNQWIYKLSNDTANSSGPTPGDLRKRSLPSFSSSVFLEYLIRFIVVDDQSICVVECPEFRDLCMVLRGDLLDGDIPHRDKIRETIVMGWEKSFTELKLDLSQAAGRVSFTADAWSSGNLASYLALTAHWISRTTGFDPTLRTALIGFHRLEKRHTGKNIADTILHLLNRARLTTNVGYFTLDNAENNAVAMQELQSLLFDCEVEFNHLKNRVRCYPHIINICATHILASMTHVSKSSLHQLRVQDGNQDLLSSDSDDSDDSDDEDPNSDDDVDDNIDRDVLLTQQDNTPTLCAWFQGMKRDPVKRARTLVRILCSSDQRREGLKNFIHARNTRGWFGKDPDQQPIQIPLLQLLRDVKTRWDSVYFMLRRLRILKPAIVKFMDMELQELLRFKLTELDWEILEGLEIVLKVPHEVQQIMSVEATPVLSGAIHSFEMFMTNWKKLGRKFPKLRPWTNIGLQWAKKYYARMDDTDAYVITMFLNPCVRLSWIRDEWDREYIENSEKMVRDLMRKYRDKKLLIPTTTNLSETLVPAVKVTAVAAIPSRFELDTPGQHFSGRKPPNPTIEDEYRRYTLAELSSRETNILAFWEAKKLEFPTLFLIAMDYLPIQASAVPCERVFSSAKETDTLKRNRIGAELMEALQMYKFALKKERLNFMNGWMTSEEAMTQTTVKTKGDLLHQLYTKDHDSVLDALLSLTHDNGPL